MIIDCHGHYTTTPAAHTAWRQAQPAAFEANHAPRPYPTISDDGLAARGATWVGKIIFRPLPPRSVPALAPGRVIAGTGAC
jgi:hypothetical protein